MTPPTILAMRVDMERGLGNQPTLHAVLDREPTDYIFNAYEGKTARIFIGQAGNGEDPWFQHYTSNSNKNGLGGREIKMHMSYGTTQTVKGPWIGSGVVEAYAGVPTMGITYVTLKDIADKSKTLEDIFNEAPKIFRQMKIAGYEIDDTKVANHGLLEEYERRCASLETLIWSDEKRYRAIERYLAADRLMRQHHKARYSSHPITNVPRPWIGDDAQKTFVYELLLWKSMGIRWAGTISVDAARQAMKTFCPQYTVYPYRWNPDSGGIGAASPFMWVPAPKASTSSIFRDDTPAPKEDGFWGYAWHDEYGYPKSPFFDTIQGLIDYTVNLEDKTTIVGENATWTVGSRHHGGWHSLSFKQQRNLDMRLGIKTIR